MTTKTKIKKTTKKKKLIKSKPKSSKTIKSVSRLTKKKKKHFHVSYLALLVAGVLLLEGLLFSISTPTDWKYGFEVLDLRPDVSAAAQDLKEVFAPAIDLTTSVNQFYVLMAEELTPLLDLSGAVEGFNLVYSGIDEFYDEASIAMADLFGITEQSFPGNVAGIWIEQ